MALFHPTINHILTMKVPPTKGELILLRFLESSLDNSFEVYFNPYMNGDKPDVVIVRKRHGVLIIEVKDWNLDAYRLDERKHWILKDNSSTRVSSPIEQVLKYKENLYTLHLDELFEKRILDYRFMNVISCAVYFHNATQTKVEDLLVNPYLTDSKYQKFLKKNIKLIGNDTLTKEKFDQILWSLYILSGSESKMFSDSLYESITHFLLPTTHQAECGKHIDYLKKQKQIIQRNDRNEFVVEGVEGSGKTTVLARRAVQEYLKWKNDEYEPQILILTYNITLTNFIRDKINQVQENFEWKSFTILNYHHFIGNQLNNLDVSIVLPQNESMGNFSERRKLTPKQSQYLDRHYYSNLQLFLNLKDTICSANLQYDAILIDEIQDYKYNWFEILKKTFLKDGGDFILFGDEKQNIYANPLNGKKVQTNVIGARMKLSQSMRSGSIIERFVTEFQKQIFADKYEQDTFENPDDGQLKFKPSGTITYKYLPNDFITSIYDIVSAIKTNDPFKDIATDDITILSFNVDVLRQFEAFYRNKTGERMMTMFETKEVIVYVNLKREWSRHKKGEKQESSNFDVQLIESLLSLLQGQDDEKLRRLSSLIVLDDLNRVYNGVFENRLDYACKKNKCNKTYFTDYMNQNRSKMSKYLGEIMTKDYDYIREHKKAHFYMHPGYMKISTIHSFKGWESKMVVLIIDKYVANNQSLDEIIYTGITRCKEHLYMINMANIAYDPKIKMLIDSVEQH